jgi:YHS domain-containing protein
MHTPLILTTPETVCGRTITGDPSFFPQAIYNGEIIYVCTEICLHIFQDDPVRFIEAHSQEDA